MRSPVLDVPVLAFADRFLELVGERQAGAPATAITWVDDLGLRRFESAGLAARVAWAARPDLVERLLARLDERDAATTELAAQRDVDVALVPRWTPTLDASLEPHVLGRTLGQLVDELGAWEDAVELADAALDSIAFDELVRTRVVEELRAHRGAATSVMRAGNVLAVARDARCLEAWELVARHAASPVDRAIAQLRMAVAWVKRLDGTAPTIDAALVRLRGAIDEIPDPADRSCVRALSRNLTALVHVRAGNRTGARREVRAAWELVADAALAPDEVDLHFLDNVRLQVLANLATVTGAAGDWGAAEVLFERGLELADRRDDDAMRMEAGCLLGYARWQRRDLEGARAAVLAADAAGESLGPTTQRAQAWKLLAVIDADSGNHEASLRWRARLATDQVAARA